MTDLSILRRKYQTRAPRYTSYPTALMFHPLEDLDVVRAAWRHANASRALYVHVPFCQKRCWYCGCQVEIRKQGRVAEDYVHWLLRELDIRLSMLETPHLFHQIALGGGTPTFLSAEQMTRLCEGLRERLPIASDAEMSIELDPRSMSPSYADQLVTLGFNRFSLGVQDFDDHVLQLVNRQQTHASVARLTEQLRQHGSVNFDLIYGLPGQTPETFARTTRAVIDLRPHRIALFGYARVPWMKPHQKALERKDFPENRAALFDLASEAFVGAGYQSIGMDHFALPSDELSLAARAGTLHRNFMGYTTRGNTDLLGIGASAISDISGVYTQNDKSSRAYIERLERDELPVARGYVLSAEDRLRRRLILSLFCNFRVTSRDLKVPLEAHFAQEYARLAAFSDDGLVALTDDQIVITPLGHQFVRNVCAVFDRYLEKDPAERRYSLTA